MVMKARHCYGQAAEGWYACEENLITGEKAKTKEDGMKNSPAAVMA